MTLDVLESELVEQTVKGAQPSHAVQPVRPWCTAETGMGGREHPVPALLGEQVRKRGDGLWAGTAIQHEERLSLASILDGQLNGADARDVVGVGSRHTTRFHRVHHLTASCGGEPAAPDPTGTF